MKFFCVLLLVRLSVAYTGPYSPVCASVFGDTSKCLKLCIFPYFNSCLSHFAFFLFSWLLLIRGDKVGSSSLDGLPPPPTCSDYIGCEATLSDAKQLKFDVIGNLRKVSIVHKLHLDKTVLEWLAYFKQVT